MESHPTFYIFWFGTFAAQAGMFLADVVQFRRARRMRQVPSGTSDGDASHSAHTSKRRAVAMGLAVLSLLPTWLALVVASFVNDSIIARVLLFAVTLFAIPPALVILTISL